MSTSDAGMFLPLGGAREIGANSYLLRLDGHDILLDCGVHPKKEGLGAVPDFSLLDRSPDAAIVSHGHVDHCGALPCLVSRFPHVAAFATAATVSVIDRMLHNSVKVMESMAVERGIRDYPLYSHDEVDCAIQRMCGEAPRSCASSSGWSGAAHTSASASCTSTTSAPPAATAGRYHFLLEDTLPTQATY